MTRLDGLVTALMRSFLLALVLAGATALSACSIMTQIAANSEGIPLESKVIGAKSEPNVLIATDGSACTVSTQRWEDAEVGESYLCAWESSRGVR